MDAAGVPEGLAAMPPGPGLAAVLGAIELGRVPNDRMLEVLFAQHRQLSHEQSRMAATLTEIGRCDGIPAPGAVARLPESDRYAPEETRAALRWTRNAAECEHDLAEAVVHAMPAVFAAWWEGDIDRPRVRVFHRCLTGLAADVIARICSVAVPHAPKLTTGQLAHLLHRMVIAADPDAAKRWYRKGVQQRGVFAHLAPDGTVTLGANGLPADQAEAACIRIERLADAAKRAGHPGRIGQIRCDVFLGLLDGRFNGMSTDQVIAALLTPPASGESENSDDGESGTDPSDPGSDPDDPDGPDTGGAGPGDGHSPDHGHPPVDDRRASRSASLCPPCSASTSTLPRSPASGRSSPPAARHRVMLQRRAQWRFAVTDHEGLLLSEGVTRRRPGSVRRAPGPAGGIVELHVPLALLRQLIADGDGEEWITVIADIARQHACAAGHLRDLDSRPGARLPSAAMRRHTEIRDRTCTHPCYRRPAHSGDQDHTVDHGRGGATVRANLGPTCRLWRPSHRGRARGGRTTARHQRRRVTGVVLDTGALVAVERGDRAIATAAVIGLTDPF